MTSANLDARVALHERYSTSRESWFSWVNTQIAWSDASDVLEVGCGTGLLWAQAPPSAIRGLSVTVCDLSQAMVNAALDVTHEVVRQVTGRVADVMNLPFDDATFDLVIANHMLYHAPDLSRALREIARVLRPGGTLVASTNGPQHLVELREIDNVVFGSTTKSQLIDAFGSESGWAPLRHYFASVEWRSREDSLVCTNADDVVAYLISAPPGGAATPEQMTLMRAEVARRMTNGGRVLRISKDSGLFLARAF